MHFLWDFQVPEVQILRKFNVCIAKAQRAAFLLRAAVWRLVCRCFVAAAAGVWEALQCIARGL